MSTVRAPGRAPARWVLAVTTVLALLGMHALLSAGPADAAAPAPAATRSAAPQPADAHPTDPAVHTGSATAPHTDGCPDCGGHGSGPDGHTLAHLCLAVLAGVLTVLAGLALARHATATPGLAGRRPAVVRAAGRAPPWTQPRLEQLSVLRV